MPAATDAKQPLPARRVRRLLQPFWASVASNHCRELRCCSRRLRHGCSQVCSKHQIASVAVTLQRSASVQSPDTNQRCRNDDRDCVNVSFGRGPGTSDHVSATYTHDCGVAVDHCLSVQTWTASNLSQVARRCSMSTLPRFLHVRLSFGVLLPSIHASLECRRRIRECEAHPFGREVGGDVAEGPCEFAHPCLAVSSCRHLRLECLAPQKRGRHGFFY
mmetsp:Transcript_17591/g.47598  ORF Transcript_17591/g.47598 Transcript_17591/m.47598 type:complete len:218 (-) Transcript_17591:61-714(-)